MIFSNESKRGHLYLGSETATGNQCKHGHLFLGPGGMPMVTTLQYIEFGDQYSFS